MLAAGTAKADKRVAAPALNHHLYMRLCAVMFNTLRNFSLEPGREPLSIFAFGGSLLFFPQKIRHQAVHHIRLLLLYPMTAIGNALDPYIRNPVLQPIGHLDIEGYILFTPDE